MTFYTRKDLDAAEKKRTALIKARNNACSAINDAQARYIKKKTGAKSRKLAMEKDALLSSPKYEKLKISMASMQSPKRNGISWRSSGMSGKRSGKRPWTASM